MEMDGQNLTDHDGPGHVQMYDALVLYADEDQAFVDEMRQRLDRIGFTTCTVSDLTIGHPTVYAPVVKLISQRCQYIILVFSPEFLNSIALKFYMDYAQAVNIESGRRKIIPIMYRQCQIPSSIAYYHTLYYQSHGEMYDFWLKLRQALEFGRTTEAL